MFKIESLYLLLDLWLLSNLQKFIYDARNPEAHALSKWTAVN